MAFSEWKNVEGVLKRITLPNAASIDIKKYTTKWAELTNINFSVVASAYTYMETCPIDPNVHHSIPGYQRGSTSYIAPTHSYNAKTGILTISLPTSNTLRFDGQAYYAYVESRTGLAFGAVYMYITE